MQPNTNSNPSTGRNPQRGSEDLKGKALQYWSRLTDNDLTNFRGNLDELRGKVQQVYGYSKDELDREFNRFSDYAGIKSAEGQSQQPGNLGGQTSRQGREGSGTVDKDDLM